MARSSSPLARYSVPRRRYEAADGERRSLASPSAGKKIASRARGVPTKDTTPASPMKLGPLMAPSLHGWWASIGLLHFNSFGNLRKGFLLHFQSAAETVGIRSKLEPDQSGSFLYSVITLALLACSRNFCSLDVIAAARFATNLSIHPLSARPLKTRTKVGGGPR
jgi:hypothetical protein